MPFGLRNAAQTLPFVYAYIDDLLNASSTPEEHLEHLRLVLKRLQEHINVAKSIFGVSALDCLGHHVDATGIRPLGEFRSSGIFPSAETP